MTDKNNVLPEEERTLQRGIKSWQVAFIALGGIIGSSYFLGLGLAMQEQGPAVIITFCIGGLIIYAVMLCFAELLVNIPRKGSFVAYTKEFIGESFSCGSGWAYWANWVGYVPSEGLAVGLVIANFLPKSAKMVNIGGAHFGIEYIIAFVVLGLITLINVFQVDLFGRIESTLAMLKVAAIAFFAVIAILIFVGFVGNGDGFIGTSVMIDPDKGFFNSIFPNGLPVLLISMVLVLVNFQGSEIVGLAASETQNPEVAIPRACKQVVYRILLIFIVPLTLLVLIFPSNLAGVAEGSVFASALAYYGIPNWIVMVFSAVVAVAAFSCANCGVYGTVRTLYGLSREGLAPKFLSNLNKYNVPKNATLATVLPTWFVLAYALFGEITGSSSAATFYRLLLGIAGFTGSVCWGGIILSQIIMRYKIKKRGYDVKAVLKAPVPLFPLLPIVGLGAIVAALFAMAFTDGEFGAFALSLGVTVGPMIAYKIAKTLGKTRTISTVGEDEVAFEDKFPPLNK